MTQRLYIEMFGGLRARSEGRLLMEFAPQQSSLLLACLALDLGKKPIREELIAQLWPEADGEEGGHRLRQVLYTLRRQLEQPPFEKGSLFRTTRTHAYLDFTVVCTDVTAFEEALASAETASDLQERIRYLTCAIDLYQGDLLPGFYLDSILAARERLAEAYRGALHALALVHEQTGALDLAIEAARKAVARDSLIEEGHCTLMRLYAAAGQPLAIRRQYQELERVLQEELGESPSEATRRLMESLREMQKGRRREGGEREDRIAGRQGDKVAITQSPNDPTTRRPTTRRFRPALMPGAAMLGALLLWIAVGHRAAPPAGKRMHVWATDPAPAPDLWETQITPLPGDMDSAPSAIWVDGAGNIYLTGFVDTSTGHDVDFLTLRFDPNGHILWQARYNGPGGDVDRARCLVPDFDNTIYVAGDSDNGKGNGQTRLAGEDICIIKYDAATGKPSPAWPDVGFGVGVRRYNGPDDGEDYPVGMHLDTQGNLYVLGVSWRWGTSRKGGWDYVLLKYDPRGNLTHTFRFDCGDGDSIHTAAIITFDREGYIFVAGSSRAESPGGPETDIVTVRLTADLRQMWTKRYGANNHADDVPCAISVDGGGSATVVGIGRGLPGTSEASQNGCIFIRYDLNGNQIGVQGIVQKNGQLERVGSVYKIEAVPEWLLTGTARDARGRLWRMVLRDEDGSVRWVTDYRLLSAIDGNIPGASLVPDGIYLCGTREPPRELMGSPPVFCMLKYDWNGNRLWEKVYEGITGYGVTWGGPAGGAVLIMGQTLNTTPHRIVLIKRRP